MNHALPTIVTALGAKRSGNGWIARCVAHEDRTPSMSIAIGDGGKLLVYCHAGCSQEAITDNLKALGLWTSDGISLAPPSLATDKKDLVRRIWSECRNAQGTLVETYLRSRCINIAIPDSLAFGPFVFHSPEAGELPAMVAAVRVWPSNEVVAIQRTYLRGDGSGKANISPSKKSLGPIRGGSVQLAPATNRVGIAEGIEDAFSAMKLDPSLPCWAALGASNLKHVVLPALPLASEVVVVADNDPSGAGQREAVAAAEVFTAQGRNVLIAHPPAPFKDFNEVICHEQPHPESLSVDDRYDFEERAGILEDSGTPRVEAERCAWLQFSQRKTITRGAA